MKNIPIEITRLLYQRLHFMKKTLSAFQGREYHQYLNNVKSEIEFLEDFKNNKDLSTVLSIREVEYIKGLIYFYLIKVRDKKTKEKLNQIRDYLEN